MDVDDAMQSWQRSPRGGLRQAWKGWRHRTPTALTWLLPWQPTLDVPPPASEAPQHDRTQTT